MKKSGIIYVLLLLGIFMGAIDSGIVSPAREIIQNSIGVSAKTGIWMITIYNLFYAISMPIASKMADRQGHKKIFILGVGVFGIGSLLCGISNFYSSIILLLTARVIQAIGIGGVIPIATTYIGHSFPEEKRGTALGMVGAVFGVATIIGPSLGSGILGLAGNDNWGWIFFINVPISLIIILLSGKMQNTHLDTDKSMDAAGAVILGTVVASLLYGLTNLNFFDLHNSIRNTSVYPYLLIFVLLLPVLIMVEKRAGDPVLNIKYFKSGTLVLIFLIAWITGVGMMGTVFVPQFAENVLRIRAGTGGYLVTLLAIFSGIAAPVSGYLLDRRGAPLVLGFGFSFIFVGNLILGYIVIKSLSFISVLIGLALVGLGIGFTMGAPLNYLILQNTAKKEGTTAMATLSLIRSIGTTMSPNILIGFITQAAANLQPRLMELFQKSMPAADPGMHMPSSILSSEKGAQAFSKLQSADVTTIVDRLKAIMQELLPPQVAPMVIQNIESMRSNIENVFQSTLNKGYSHMFTAAAVIAAAGFVLTMILSRYNRREAE